MSTSEMSAPLEWWQGFSDLGPAGHVLRVGMAQKWCRFHSLPESKRYPESADEMEEILRRHRVVADALFQPGEDIYIYRARFMVADSRKPKPGRLSGVPLSRESIVAPACIPADPDEMLKVWARVAPWRPKYFEKVVEKIAREHEHMITFASPASERIFCPYDGGMDVFAEEGLIRELASKYLNWRSDRSDGL